MRLRPPCFHPVHRVRPCSRALYYPAQRGSQPSTVDVGTPQRQLRDVDAVPFRAAIQEAGLVTVMNAYNDLDGLAIAGL